MTKSQSLTCLVVVVGGGGGGVGEVLTYFPTFVPEFKNDKIPKSPVSVGSGGGGVCVGGGGILLFQSSKLTKSQSPLCSVERGGGGAC